MESNFIQKKQTGTEMNSIRIDSYEIKTSRNNLKVPVINDVHLHSIYDPAKEAQAIVSKHDSNLQNINKVLVLGLGFAYHVYEVCRKLESYHGNDYQVIVIEPNKQIYQDCVANHLFPNKNIKVHTGENLDLIYSDLDLIKFLTSKPIILSHPASFSLYTNYFKNFLEYNAPKKIKDIKKHISNQNFRTYLDTENENITIEEFVFDNLLNKQKLSGKYDHLMLAYTHLSNGDF